MIENGLETKCFCARCPIEGEVNSWVAENVVPQMASIKETHNNYSEMLKEFAKFYLENKQDAQVSVHMGVPVETRLFLEMHELGFIGDFEAPYPLIDISALPSIGTSVDTYNSKHALYVPDCDGGTHNPLYDCRAAAIAYYNLRCGGTVNYDISINSSDMSILANKGICIEGKKGTWSGTYKMRVFERGGFVLKTITNHYPGGGFSDKRVITQQQALFYLQQTKEAN